MANRTTPHPCANVREDTRGRLGRHGAGRPSSRPREARVFWPKKTGRISVRVSRALVERTKRATGLDSDTALIAFAHPSVALGDHVAETLIGARGSVDPDLKLGF